MRLWLSLVVASALLFPLEARATIADIKILSIDGIGFLDCPSDCGFGSIDYEERGDGGLSKYDFHSEDWFDSSGFGQFALKLGIGQISEDGVEAGIPPIYRLRIFEGDEVWADAVTTDFSVGAVGFWSTAHFDGGFDDEVHVDFQVLGGPPPPRIPEPGSLLLLLSGLGLWFGFKFARVHRSVRDS